MIKTAIVEHVGEDLNGPTLTVLRNFRDTHLIDDPLLWNYHDQSLELVERLNELHNAHTVYLMLNRDYIQPAVACIKDECYADALDLYASMMAHAKELVDGSN